LEININSLIIQSIKNWPQKIKEIHHMIRLSVKLKKLLLISFLSLFGAIINNIDAQDIVVKLTKDSVTVNGKTSFTITLKVTQGSAPFNIAIFKDKPGKTENLVQNFESYNSKELKIENIISKGTYYIAVSSLVDGKGKLIHITI